MAVPGRRPRDDGDPPRRAAGPCRPRGPGGGNFRLVLDEGYIGNVAVTPGHRRQGVGDALLAALTALGRERGLAFLTLEVRESNLPARRLYEKHGFRPAGCRRGYYSRPREDAILMTLEFEHI